jgi:ArsR family transcriptional regulator, arsenate/arsenite/antimonite-responsive transcriptional repressor
MNEVFRALGDPTRRRILQLLKRGDRTAGELAEAFPLAKSTLSGHFNVLRQAGLIVSERRGTTVRYSLNLSALEEAMAAVLELLETRRTRKERRS